MTTRFQPERAGIINLWHFREVEFPFADGRLVLRGPNGAGKTKALEMLFPLLLDGSLDPRRIDPFSSAGRGMRDNVLAAADASGHRAAVGYAWMTFGRSSEAGAPEHVTVGIGVSASHDRDRVDSWTFVADQVPGVDMRLLDDEDRPLSRAALKQLVGPDHVFETVDAHRRAVDARLFGLGDERFHRMVELVLQLRKPKLAALLDPERISLLLSQSLQPIDAEPLEDVARGLAELERIAEEIGDMERSVRSLDALHRDYSTYLRAHARARLDALLLARDGVSRLDDDLLANASSLTEAEAHASEQDRLAQARRDEASAAAGEAGGLQQSELYKAGLALVDRRLALSNLEDADDLANRRHAEAERGLKSASARCETASKELDQLKRAILAGAAQLRRDAQDAVGDLSDELLGEASEVRVAIHAAAAARRSALVLVREAVFAWENAGIRVSEAAAAASTANDEEQAARSARLESAATVATRRLGLANGVRRWSELHEIVTDDDRDALLVRTADGSRDDVSSLPAFIRERWEPRKLELVAEEQRAASEAKLAEAALVDLTAQRDRVSAAEEEAPPDSPWRTASRQGRAGAPLWRLVDFAPHLDTPERAGLEGALLAAGILDAWVDPPAVVRPFVIDDAFLVPTERQVGEEGPTLADVLVPDGSDAGLEGRVLDVLRSVSLGQLDQVSVGIDVAGRFRIGPLVGAFRAQQARYVGASAREAERARRLFELDAAITIAEGEVAGRRAALRAVQAARAAIDSGILALPDVRPLVDALDVEARREQRLENAVEARRAADATLANRRRDEEDADSHRRRLATAHGLPEDRPRLEAAGLTLANFERHADTHIGRLEQRPRAEERCTETLEQLANAERSATASATDHAEIHRRLVQERAELTAIESSLGTAHSDLVTQIERARAREREASLAANEHREKADKARQNVAARSAERPQLERRREDAAKTCLVAGNAVEAIFHPAFALVLELGDSPDIDRLMTACGDVSATDQQLKRVVTALQKRFEELQKDAGARLRVTLTLQHDLHLIEIDDEDRTPSAVYALRLAQRLADHRALLADRERDIFEDHLLGTLCTALYQRLRAARAFARDADRELQRRSLASGVHFGLQWKPRQDVAPHEAVLLDVLRRDADHLGPGDLDLVRRALRDALAHLRTEMPSADQRALLDRALDYRVWHRFSISLHRPAGKPVQELTKLRHAQLSGGEKAAALYAPLFAAARATFAGGFATAPRLVALDEAFEGVDAHGRPELLAMTVAFDLDLLLTGYDLWLADAAVPSAMHAQMHHDPAMQLAIVELVKWDGQVLEDVDAPVVVREAG